MNYKNIFSDFNLFFMAFSIPKHWEIIFLHLHKLGPKLSFKAIAKELHWSLDTVCKGTYWYQETGDVQDQSGRGVKCKTSEIEDTKIIATAKRLRTGSLADISTILNRQGTSISLTNVNWMRKVLQAITFTETTLNWYSSNQ